MEQIVIFIPIMASNILYIRELYRLLTPRVSMRLYQKGEYICWYMSVCSLWGMRVPAIDTIARRIIKKTATFIEVKNSQIESIIFFLLSFNIWLHSKIVTRNAWRVTGGFVMRNAWCMFSPVPGEHSGSPLLLTLHFSLFTTHNSRLTISFSPFTLHYFTFSLYQSDSSKNSQ